MALEPWRIAKVVKIEQQTKTTRRFFFEVPELEQFNFKPGQFVTLDLPIHEKPNKRWRSYSISSCPNGTNKFELCIVLLENGAGTNYLFNQVEVGSEISFRGPAGVFTLPDLLQNDVFLICTGTGIAPFRSMIHHIVNERIAHKNIHLIFGCRHFDDLLYADEFAELMKLDPDFYFYTAFSREQLNEGSRFQKAGYVHQIYEDICNTMNGEEANDSDPNLPQPANFYLCGWRGMVDEAKPASCNWDMTRNLFMWRFTDDRKGFILKISCRNSHV
jgi:CDP-4-dehydro-6-deoxyglucose reductase